MSSASFPHVRRERVRFRDCDAMGHVNNAVYSTYLEQARIGVLGGLDPYILARVEIDFRAPAVYDEEIEVGVRPSHVGTKSFHLDSPIYANGRLVAESNAVLVGYDYDRGQTIPIPEQWRRKLAV